MKAPCKGKHTKAINIHNHTQPMEAPGRGMKMRAINKTYELEERQAPGRGCKRTRATHRFYETCGGESLLRAGERSEVSA